MLPHHYRTPVSALRDCTPSLPASLDDVSDALSDAQAEAHDASEALSRALKSLHSADCTDAAHQLSVAVAGLREALKRAEAAASPMVQWADRESGDW